MLFRDAKIDDIKGIQFVRNSVKENVLSNPLLISDEDCKVYITDRGKGWICEIDNKVVGFSIVDLKMNNIWALFVHPEFENLGIGKTLHNLIINWYFEQTCEKVWLGTEPKTKAEKFYKKLGWKEVGKHGKIETKFEMTYANWVSKK